MHHVLPEKLVDEAYLDELLQCVAVCCSALQCVAVCCSVLQCVAVRCSVWACYRWSSSTRPIWTRCCSVLQCVAVRCSALQCVSVLPVKLVDEAHLDKMLQCVAVCCSALQCVAVCERATGEARRRGPFGQDVACAFRAWGCPCCRNSKSFDTPLGHIRKNQLATSTTMHNDYRALFPESLRFSSLGLPLLPRFEVIWYTTGTHSQRSAHY